MDLVNMKSPPKDAHACAGGCCSPCTAPAEPAYPYGLRISLNDESLKQLGITTFPKVNGQMKLIAIVEVVSTSEYESKEGGENKSLELQITDMAIASVKNGADLKVLYPSMTESSNG